MTREGGNEEKRKGSKGKRGREVKGKEEGKEGKEGKNEEVGGKKGFRH